jgi:hypothetical protein
MRRESFILYASGEYIGTPPDPARAMVLWRMTDRSDPRWRPVAVVRVTPKPGKAKR